MSADNNHNLTNVNFSNWNERLNSPKSIEACRRLGIDPKELYQVAFDDYVSTNVEIKGSPKEVQLLRYQNIERLRMDNIRNCIEERDRIIENLKKFDETQFQRSLILSQPSNSVGLFGHSKNLSSMDKEQKSIEKLKMRQKAEVENLIDQELKLEMLRKENEQKEFLSRMKDERMKEAMKRKQKMQDEMRRQRELMKQIQSEKEFEDIQRKLQMKQQEEFVKKEFLAEKAKRKQYVMMMKKEIQIQKTKEKKMSSERMFQEQQRKVVEKQLIMEERERFRKAYEEQKNLYKKMENARAREIQQNRISKIKDMMEFKIMRQQQELERKDVQVEQRKKFFEMQQKFSLQSPITTEVYEPNKSNEVFSHSQTLPVNKREKVKMAKMRNQMDQVMRSNSIINKLDMVEQNIKLKEFQKEKIMMYKNEMKAMKREEFKQNIKKKDKVHEYYREMNMRRLREKEDRAMELKMRKMEMLNYKKAVQEENSKNKKQVIELFDKMMRNSNSISPEIIQQMFPGEQSLINKLLQLKDINRSVSPMARSNQSTEGRLWNQTELLNNSF